jgi:hypothetical protein
VPTGSINKKDEVLKIVVVGRGVAALGFLEQLVSLGLTSGDKARGVEVSWIGASPIDSSFPTCSVNSTALVGLHGIQCGLSPLGDLLHNSFFQTEEFIKNHKPDGVTAMKRLHVDRKEKLEDRFSHNREIVNQTFFAKEMGLGVFEQAYSFEPVSFMNWWSDRLFHFGLSPVDEFVTAIEDDRVIGLKEDYPFDLCINATGALGLKLGFGSPGTLVPGQYLVFNDVCFQDCAINDSFVVSNAGFNLIYNKQKSTLVYGGTDEKDELLCPKVSVLRKSLDQLLTRFPQFNFTGDCQVKVGARQKAPKRMPQIIEQGNIFHICGLYKNGYTLCHALGQQLAQRINSLIQDNERLSP